MFLFLFILGLILIGLIYFILNNNPPDFGGIDGNEDPDDGLPGGPPVGPSPPPSGPTVSGPDETFKMVNPTSAISDQLLGNPDQEEDDDEQETEEPDPVPA